MHSRNSCSASHLQTKFVLLWVKIVFGKPFTGQIHVIVSQNSVRQAIYRPNSCYCESKSCSASHLQTKFMFLQVKIVFSKPFTDQIRVMESQNHVRQVIGYFTNSFKREFHAWWIRVRRGLAVYSFPYWRGWEFECQSLFNLQSKKKEVLKILFQVRSAPYSISESFEVQGCTVLARYTRLQTWPSL